MVPQPRDVQSGGQVHHPKEATPPPRSTQRMDPIGRGESVRRSLFGPVDHDQLRRDLALQLREMAERDSRRWNFNFQAETPLSGRFQWEEVPADCAAEPGEGGRPGGREDGSGTDQENRAGVVSNARKRPADATPLRRRKRTLSKPAAGPGALCRITDFFAKRRRTTETKGVVSSSEAAPCRTIR